MTTTGTANRLPSLLRAAAGYTAATIISILVGGVASVTTARVLGPTLTGLWDLLQLVPTYNVTNVGIVNGMQRELPIARGRGDSPEAVDAIRDQALLATVLPTVFVAVAYFVVEATLDAPAGLRVGLALYAIAIVLLQTNSVLFVIARSLGRFHAVSANTLLYGGLLILPPLLAFFFGFPGQAAGTVLFAAISTVALLLTLRIRRWPRPRLDVSRRLLRAGFPIMVLGFVQVLLFTGERGLIVAGLGAEALGTFRVATLTAWALYVIAEVSNQIVYPTLGEAYGARGVGAVRDALDLALRPLAFVAPALSGVAWFLIPGVTTILLPQFTAGIAPARLMSFAVVGLVLASIPGVAMLVLRRELLFLALSSVALALKLGGVMLAISTGAGLVGIVAADALAYFTLFMLTFFIVESLVDGRVASLFQQLLRVAWPIVASAALVFVVSSIVNRVSSTPDGLLPSVAGGAAFLIGYGCLGLLSGDARRLTEFVRLGFGARA